uniref:Uncharacterized protein n=1 Tax=Oryza meridionalis TaxID=40149 RepID=A0A0E0CA34_9ORYZ
MTSRLTRPGEGNSPPNWPLFPAIHLLFRGIVCRAGESRRRSRLLLVQVAVFFVRITMDLLFRRLGLFLTLHVAATPPADNGMDDVGGSWRGHMNSKERFNSTTSAQLHAMGTVRTSQNYCREAPKTQRNNPMRYLKRQSGSANGQEKFKRRKLQDEPVTRSRAREKGQERTFTQRVQGCGSRQSSREMVAEIKDVHFRLSVRTRGGGARL